MPEVPSDLSRTDSATRRWRSPLVVPRTLLRVVVLLLLAAAIFGAYFTFWFLSRDAYFTTRNFRILAGLGKQIESIIEVQSDGLRYGAPVDRRMRRDSTPFAGSR